MAIRFQICYTLSETADTTALTNRLVTEWERESPSKHSVFTLREGDVRDEFSALQTAAMYAVRLPYTNDRIYVSLTCPAKNSRKRNVDGNRYIIFAAVAYDYHAQ